MKTFSRFAHWQKKKGLVWSKLCFFFFLYDIAIAGERQFPNFVTDINQREEKRGAS
jgi:hypothetical protein